MESFRKIVSEEEAEYQSIIQTIYSIAVNEDAYRQKPYENVLIGLRENIERLIKELKKLNTSIKKYIDKATENKDAAEIIEDYFTYHKEIGSKAYHRLKTSDNISRYRPQILDRLSRFTEDEDILSRTIRGYMEIQNEEDPAKAASEIKGMVSKMKENIEMARRTFDELNKVLKGIDYNGVFYRFLYSADKNKKRLYDMIMDNSNLGGYTLFTDSFEASYREEMEDLFGKLRAQDTNGAQVLDEYSDYRNYLDYDIEIKEGEKIIRFSSVGAESSGGETQVPYYVIIAASFNQIYKDDTIKLIMLDEAFDKMDDFRIDSMLHFFTKLGFQMILATPPQKVPVISESVKSVFMTIRQGEKSTIVPYYNERV